MRLWPWWLYNTWLPATALAKDIGVCWILIEANRVVRSMYMSMGVMQLRGTSLATLARSVSTY